MTKVYATWYGGSSYAEPRIPEHVEVFPSIAAAVEEFRSRYSGWGRFAFLDRWESGRTPAVDRTAYMHLYFYDPRDVEDWQYPYPDRVIEFGPRGGVKAERV